MKARRAEAAAIACGSLSLLAIACGGEPAHVVAAQRLELIPVASASASLSAAPSAPARIAGECAGADCFTTSSGFRHLHPTPHSRTLESVVSIRRNEAWAVGSGGTMLRLRGDRVSRVVIPDLPSAAQTFEAIDPGSTKDAFKGSQFWLPKLDGIVAPVPDDVFVLVNEHNVAHFDGTRWTMERSNFGNGMIAGVGGAPFVFPSIVRDGGKWGPGPKLPPKSRVRAGVTVGDSVWLGSDNGVILVSRGGKDFTIEADFPDAGDFVQIWIAPGEKYGLAVTRNDEVFERVDGKWGKTDPVATAPRSREEVSALWSTPDGNELWVVGEKIFRRTRRGPWQPLPVPGWARGSGVDLWEGDRFHAISGTASDDVWIVGRWGVALHWDGKRLHDVTRRQTDADIEGLFPIGDDEWLALGRDGTVLRGSKEKIEREADTDKDLFHAFRTDDGSILAYSFGSNLRVRRGPGSWEQLPKTDGLPRALAGPSPSSFVAVGSEGKAWRVDDGKWKALRTGVTGDLNAVAFAGPRDVWIAGDGAILRGDGRTFRIVQRHEHDEYRAISVRGPDDVWIAGDANDVGSSGLVLHWNGKRFTRHENVSAHAFRAVVASASGIWAVGLAGDAAFYDGSKWHVADTDAETLSSILRLKDGTIVAAGEGGAIVTGPATFDGSKAAPPKAARP